MKKKFSFPLVLICVTLFASSLYSQTIDYNALGKLPNSDSIISFAPGFISLENRFERVVAFDPDGSELFFSVFTKDWEDQRIYTSNYLGGEWQQPEMADFSKEYRSTEPFMSPDGQKLFFVSNRPPGSGWNFDIWMLKKEGTGWSEPIRLDDNVNTDEGEWHPCVTSNNDLYFAAVRANGFGEGDIYFSKFDNGKYTPAKNMGKTINTGYNEWDPYVNPAGEYMIFKSDRPEGFGEFDMYISIMNNGEWSAPMNLGPSINTKYNDDSGDVTPDGKYLIFARMEHWEFSDIYWIETTVIKNTISKMRRSGK